VAEAGRPRRVLAVSTDPAHSLGDALGVKLSAQPRQVTQGFAAVELDASRAFARWLQEHRGPLREILEHGTWLDQEDVDALLDLSIPGVDELVGLMEIARLARTPSARSGYDLVVVDTAPTGHTLRLLAAPDAVAAVAAVLDLLQQEHSMIREQLARVGRPEAADTLITLLAAQARETAERLHDARQTAFHWVTLPEELSLAESEDAIAALERAGMRVPEILVNRVLPDAGPCPVCDRRRADERRVLAAIRRRLGRGRRVRVIPAAIREPRGLTPLAKFGRAMAQASGSAAAVRRGSVPAPVGHRLSGPPAGARLAPPESLDALRGASLLFFGGKGGVGKTTAAAAAALRLARADASRKVLLLSTDPAHSLADVFKSAVGDTARAIRGGPRNLLVRELDAAAALAERRAHLESALDEIASAVGVPGIAADLNADRGVLVRIPASGIGRELINHAPPGIDELFGILSVVDARADYDLIVVDTAPTGHALRLLEMPDAAREWMQVLLRVLLKYRSLVRPGQLAAELVDVSKSIRELQLLLHDATQTRFIVVTRAAEVPRRETERLLTRLRRLRLSTPAVIFNALTMAPGRCARCRATAAAERRELAALRTPRGCVIIRTPLSAPPPRGVPALERWAGLWVGEGIPEH
jgi:arsenite-transporting ATPase